MLLREAPYLPDVDTLYHFKVARLILERGPWVDIDWLPFTVLGEHGPDHHWLFHLLVAPLTAWGQGLREVQVACAVAAAAMTAALHLFLRRAGVPWAALFAVAAMFASEDLPFRFLMLRAQDLAVVFMVASMFLMAWRRSLGVGIVAFAFTESYHGAVILATILAATLAVQAWHERRITPRLVTAVAGGVFAGLLLSPWFPRNVSYLVFHTVFKTASTDPALVGGEWLRPTLELFLRANAPAHALLLSGLAALVLARRAGVRPAQDTLTSLVLTLVFGAMTFFMAGRFIEYYGPFAAVTAGLLWRDAHAARAVPSLPWRVALPLVLSAILAYGVPRSAALVERAANARYDESRAVMAYVDEHDPRPMVFNARWSDFQQLVFWSDRSRYVAGLDGNYLRFGPVPARYALWHEIASGEANTRHDNAARIRATFGARWIVLAFYQDELARALAADPDASLVMHRPGEGWLFEIKQPASSAPG